MSDSPDQHLFVYGTLAPGEVNEHVLSPLDGDWQIATVKGSLHPEGWGASYGFPAMRLDSNADEVSGQLFSSPLLPQHWQELDEFEGAAYKRVITTVKLADGCLQQANVYVLNEGYYIKE
ncbi:MAG: gamma-glutamylcyclotransferase [Pseudomonadales bacterium]|nr:gamma-glutamylcyclotransferase [Pseudomonadales bacterium]